MARDLFTLFPSRRSQPLTPRKMILGRKNLKQNQITLTIMEYHLCIKYGAKVSLKLKRGKCNKHK